MKKVLYLILPFAAIACGGNETDETTDNENNTDSTKIEEVVEKEPKRKSPREQKAGSVYGMTVNLDYSSPRVKERTIWGDLVPYDEVWRAGADEVSAITFGSAAFFGGSEVDAGTYGMFIIPKEEGDWTFILNEEWSHEEHGVWGAYDYKEEKDVLRLDVTPEWTKENIEELSYDVTAEGDLVFSWEYLRLTISIGPVAPQG